MQGAGAMPSPGAPSPGAVGRFEQALQRALGAGAGNGAAPQPIAAPQGAGGLPGSGTVDQYTHTAAAQAVSGPGDAAVSKVGDYAHAMSTGFRQAMDESFAKLANLDFTDPASLVNVIEVHMGVMSAGTQVQFATKVADQSVHGLTTLFRNQG
jgi:hypothetical protein